MTPCAFRNSRDRPIDSNTSRKGGCKMKKTTKGIKKDKKFWADPMCFPAFVGK